MYFLLSACQSPLVLKIIYFINLLLKVVFIAAPIILIIMVAIDIFQLVMNPEQKIGDSKKSAKEDIRRLLPKRIGYALILFFVPVIVKFTMNVIADVVDPDANTFLSCLYPEKSDIERAESNYQELLEQEQAEMEEYYKKKSEEVASNKKEPEKKNVTGTSSSSKADATILVGDSRMVSLCQITTNNEECVAEVGMGYNWFVNTAIDEVESKMKNGNTYNIVFNLGVNDPYNVKNYAEKLNSLKEGDWSKHNIIVVSVNPIDDSNSSYDNIKNKDVIEFNAGMKYYLSSDIKYCDVYSKISSNFSTTDGLHYTSKTTKQIYEYINKCL